MFLIVNASRDSPSWPMVRGLREGLDPPFIPPYPEPAISSLFLGGKKENCFLV